MALKPKTDTYVLVDRDKLRKQLESAKRQKPKLIKRNKHGM